MKSEKNDNIKNKIIEEDTMDATAIKKIDKTLLNDFTLEKKKLLKSLQGIAPSPIDYNKIGEEQENEKDKRDMDATAIKVDNSSFNSFLKLNKAKIDSITPQNPGISKDDEWQTESCWDDDAKE